MESMVRGQLAEAIPATLLPQSIAIPVEESSVMSLRLAKVDASSGWLTLSLNIESRQQPVSEEVVPSPAPAPAPVPLPAEGPTARRLKTTTPLRGPARIPSATNESWTSKSTRKPRDPAGWFE